ncbi:retrovirus-related pol polyprotein from transposon TNT 1-94 [Tanacetum coccineum]
MIKSLSGKDSLENVKKDIDEIETINIKLEHSVAKLLSENECLRKEREHLKSIYKDQFDSIIKICVQSKEQCDSLIAQINAKSVENSDLNAQLQEKVFANAAFKNELRKLKGKMLKNNRNGHEVYIEKTIENTDTLCGLVECAIEQNPSEPLLEFACMFTKHVQELLVYVSKTCPSLMKPCVKLVVVTPINKDKGVKPTTSASGSKPSGNPKNNRITRPPSSNQKNKVEDHSRKVKSSLNKMNSISESVSSALVKHSVRNAKFESIYAICNRCLFDANHDMCIIDYVNDVNVRLKSKSKRNKMRKVWKPTGKVFSEIGYSWKATGSSSKVKIVESKTSNSKESKQSWGSTVSDVPSSSLNDYRLSNCTVRFGNDRIAKIIGYGDYQMGNVTISRVYYADGLGHNLFFMVHFCDSDLEVAFRKYTCFIRDLDGVDLLNGSRGPNLYTLSMDNLLLSSPICLLSKASKTKSSLRSSKTKVSEGSLVLCLCSWPMRVQSINGRKYILVIVDDFSRFTWVKFLRSKDEVPEFVIKFLKMSQFRLNATIRNSRIDNGTEFINQTLRDYYEEALLFLWAEAVVIACYTQNRSLIRKCHNKIPYELLHDRKPDLSYLHVFGALCYPTNDSEDDGKLKPKADIGIFVGYAPAKKAFPIYNKRTCLIIKTIHVDFDELSAMAFE